MSFGRMDDWIRSAVIMREQTKAMEPDPNFEKKPQGSSITVSVGLAFAPAALFVLAALLQRSALGISPSFLGNLFFWILGLGLVSSIWAGLRLSPGNKVGAFFLGLGIWFVNAVISMFGCSLVSL
jgi:hypothetical protein